MVPICDLMEERSEWWGITHSCVSDRYLLLFVTLLSHRCQTFLCVHAFGFKRQYNFESKLYYFFLHLEGLSGTNTEECKIKCKHAAEVVMKSKAQ